MKFFVSSTYKDNVKERETVINFLESLFGEVKTESTGEIVAMERFPASSCTPKEVCLEQLRNCDVVIGIYGSSYGTIDSETGKSFTELEFDTAVENNIPILAFINNKKQDSLETKFINDKVINPSRTCTFFSNETELADKLNESLNKYFNGFEGYSYSSLWNRIKELKVSLASDDLQMEPYLPSDSDKAIDSIIQCAKCINSYYDDFYSENMAAYEYAYKYNYSPDTCTERDKKSLIRNVEKYSATILKNWEMINLGLHNCTQKIVLAAMFLKLYQMQIRLLTEHWSESLRNEVLAVRDEYDEVITKSKHYD